ncbi:spore coat protein [Cuneatibacter caecimuris]|uniref:Coat F domain-containing protein n=1 Tax=Cuneatibacter caecimuris TaxID=1796618 RepID=A0A4Q7PN99_9FIRM|nr:spore coat protein [Cuneatibacter caecimuris]RZT02429.1 coat F domain-containing protein [Cuneatibacter caecimuris]
MDEKTMVADTLTQVNGSLDNYGYMISQTANPQLRQTLIQMRNSCETSQYELYQIAKQHGYYQPAAQVTREEVDQVKAIFNGSTASYKSML